MQLELAPASGSRAPGRPGRAGRLQAQSAEAELAAVEVDGERVWDSLPLVEYLDEKFEVAPMSPRRRRHTSPHSHQHYHRAHRHLQVPRLVDALCAERVIAQSFVSGVTLDQLCGSHVSQAVRDDVADRLVRLKMKEMFHWRFLNADPHLGNFV